MILCVPILNSKISSGTRNILWISKSWITETINSMDEKVLVGLVPTGESPMIDSPKEKNILDKVFGGFTQTLNLSAEFNIRLEGTDRSSESGPILRD